MKSPSWTTVTPGIFFRERGVEGIQGAWKAEGRSTRPCNMPGKRMSEEYLCLPVTKSRPFTLGTEVPAIFQSAAGVAWTIAHNGFDQFLALGQLAEGDGVI